MEWPTYLLLLAGCGTPTPQADDGSRPQPVAAPAAGDAAPTVAVTAAPLPPRKLTAGPPPEAEASVPTCSVEVRITSPTTYKGQSNDAPDREAATKAAMQSACDKFVAAERIDCAEARRLATSNNMSIINGKVTRKNSVTIARVWLGTGTASSDDGTGPACLAAQTAACQGALGTDCPAEGVRVIGVNGVEVDRPLIGTP